MLVRFSMSGRQGICRLLDGILLYKITLVNNVSENPGVLRAFGGEPNRHTRVR
jgi:hypothetical protein